MHELYEMCILGRMSVEPHHDFTKPPAILLVEDESMIALDLEGSLQRLGFDVLGIAETGQQALDMAAARTPDLVLMDIHLSGQMDGITAASLIREVSGVLPSGGVCE